jgi:N-acetylneuraminic acid mutarotase
VRALLLLGCLFGCTLDSTHKHFCDADIDCDPGRICAYGRCADRCPECFVASLHPELARGGDTLILEGTFGGGTRVTFPSGAEVPAVLLGAHRALVLVPNDAGLGALTIHTADRKLTAPFEYLDHSLEPQPGGADYPQVGLARSAPHFVSARSDFALITWGGFVYAIGGAGVSGALASVERARINADGTLDPFSGVGSALKTARLSHRAVVVGDQLYVVGGVDDGGSPVASVEVATLGSQGIGGFTFAESALHVPRSRVALAVVGDGLYVIGGQAAGGASRAVERASLGIRLRNFEMAPPLLGPRAAAAAVVTDRALLILGGNDGTQSLGTVESADLRDGQVRQFAAVGTAAAPGDVEAVTWSSHTFVAAEGGVSLADPLPSPIPDIAVARSGFELVRTGEALHLLGGVTADGNPRSDAEWLPLTVDHGLDAVSPMPSPFDLKVARSLFSLAVAGDHLYVIGGQAANGSYLDSWESIHVLPDGDLDPQGWTLGGSVMGKPRASHASVVLDRSLCVLGGETIAFQWMSEVRCATMTETGDLKNWKAVTADLKPGRRLLAAAVVGRFLYVFGGFGQGNNYLDVVQRSPLGVDGALGEFEETGLTLRAPALQQVPVIVGNQLYLLGGFDTSVGGGYEVDGTTIGVDGALTPFAKVVSAERNAESRPMVALVGRSAYLLGGLSRAEVGGPPTTHDDVWKVDFNVHPPVQVQDKTLHLTTPRSLGAAVTLGNYVYVIGGSQSSVGDLGASETTLSSLERARIR